MRRVEPLPARLAGVRDAARFGFPREALARMAWSTFGKSREALAPSSPMLSRPRSSEVRPWSEAVDASVMEADASRYHDKTPDEIDWLAPERQTRAVAEFLSGLDDEDPRVGRTACL